jgi:hypothetical protein
VIKRKGEANGADDASDAEGFELSFGANQDVVKSAAPMSPSEPTIDAPDVTQT